MFTLLTTTPNVHFCTEFKKKFPARVVSPKDISVPLTEVEGILYPRNLALDYCDDDLLIISEWEKLGKVIVPRKTIEAFRDKRQQYITLRDFGFPVISTMDIGNKNSLMGFIENNPAEKFILKPRRGAKGRGVLKLDASALVQTTDLLREMGDTRFIVSPYLEHVTELRLMCYGDELLGCIAKGKDYNEWKEVSAPAELVSLLSSLDQFKFGIWAIDFLQIGHDFKVLELNLNPGIEYFIQVTGQNPLNRLNLSY